MITVYCYQNCSTCREALRWLAERGIAHSVKEIRETPPSVGELRTALRAFDGDLRKLFSTSGTDYRALGIKDQLATMPAATAFKLLSHNGNLVKRPFLIGDGKVLIGFKRAEWERALR